MKALGGFGCPRSYPTGLHGLAVKLEPERYIEVFHRFQQEPGWNTGSRTGSNLARYANPNYGRSLDSS